ncbi:MAG: VOC family protein [Bacteroidota bacterium]
MGKIKKIKETCLYVTDLDQTEKFYHGLLGFPIIFKKAGRHIFFRVGSDVLLCFIAEITRNDTHLPPHFGSGEQHLAFEVSQEDYDSMKADLKNLDIPVIHEEHWRGNIYSVYFKDPDGHLLEVVTEGLWDY